MKYRHFRHGVSEHIRGVENGQRPCASSVEVDVIESHGIRCNGAHRRRKG